MFLVLFLFKAVFYIFYVFFSFLVFVCLFVCFVAMFDVNGKKAAGLL